MRGGILDSGDIILQKNFPIFEDTNISDVYDVLYEEIPKSFEEAIYMIEKMNFVPLRQNEEVASRCFPRVPHDSFIDWNENCEKISRIIRASASPFVGAYTYYNDKKCYIHHCEIEHPKEKYYAIPGQVVYRNIKDGLIKIAAGDGFICVREFIVNDHRIKASEVVRSLRARMNYHLQDEIYEIKKLLIRISNTKS